MGFLSETIVYRLEVKLPRAVAQASHLTVMRHIKGETVTFQRVEFTHYLARQCVEALRADLVVAAPCNYERLLGDEAHGIDDWVDEVAARERRVPLELHDWLGEVSEVPQLDAFSEGAAACHNVVVVMRDVDAIPRN